MIGMLPDNKARDHCDWDVRTSLLLAAYADAWLLYRRLHIPPPHSKQYENRKPKQEIASGPQEDQKLERRAPQYEATFCIGVALWFVIFIMLRLWWR
jgi:hypothetical protein